MKTKTSLSLYIAGGFFLVAALVNAIVLSAHILTAVENADKYDFNASIQIIMIAAGISVVIFLGSGLAVLLTHNITKGISREKSYWLTVIVAIIVSVLIHNIFDGILKQYDSQGFWMAAIAGFSCLVSMAAQYQAFLHGPGSLNNLHAV